MTAMEVKDKLERATRLYVQADKDKNPSTLTMIPGVHSEEDLADLAENPPSYTMLLQLEEKIRDMRLKGIPGIERANPQLDDKTGESTSRPLAATCLVSASWKTLTAPAPTPTTSSKSTITSALRLLVRPSSTNCR